MNLQHCSCIPWPRAVSLPSGRSHQSSDGLDISHVAVTTKSLLRNFLRPSHPYTAALEASPYGFPFVPDLNDMVGMHTMNQGMEHTRMFWVL